MSIPPPPPPTDDGVRTSSSRKKIIVGVCAMQRKATSKPMRAIMAKIVEYYKDWLEYFVFPEDVILNEPVDRWPLCDCLISFHSSEFPLHKAIEYKALRKPYVINDLQRQYDLLDRAKVFDTLKRKGIDHPKHGVVRRDTTPNDEHKLVEHPDHIEIDGMVFNKPFVEKPLSAEDHNVYIYYPSSVGGGSQRLFRKINNRSSWYSPTSSIRRDGSYIYEEFLPADGIDVKVYAVGPYYAHAEARKAPGLDGKVERDADGKEVRYPVILSSKEKLIARKVVLAFGQTVCGFDLLRANGTSYVCDVNGFSFVKTSTKYYEDTAKILGDTILRHLGIAKISKSIAPTLSNSMTEYPQIDLGLGDGPPALVPTPSGKLMELRCVLAVIRHGDRTPKQKMKVVVDDKRFFELFEKYDGYKKNEIKMKRPNQLNEVLELVRELEAESNELRTQLTRQLAECEFSAKSSQDVEASLERVEDAHTKWQQMRAVLEMYGHFSGINRKVQLKYLKAREVKSSESEDASSRQGPALQFILKWGGELTTAGNLQAEALGKLFRTLYPGIRRTDGKNCPEDTQGLGFLRLHSTYRHDLKIYASDEGRVQMTAAAFAKGLLALEGELTPIMMQMVKSANTDGLLDDDGKARDDQTGLKRFLHQILQVDRDWTSEDAEMLNPNGLKSIQSAMEMIKNPRRMCAEIALYVQRMCDVINWHSQNKPRDKKTSLYLNESFDLAERRWRKELREFQRPNRHGDVEYDITKIPDIYDNIKYDMEHNPELCESIEGEFERFYLCVKAMADIVVPQEYGIKVEDKLQIAQRVCTPLVRKIRADLHRCIESTPDEEIQTRLDPRASEGIATPCRHVRTRLYFTSESHIHTLMNVIRYGGLCSVDDKKWQRAMNFLSSVTEFNYMTQVVLMVYEDNSSNAKNKFHIELLFSPGLYPCFLTEKERIYETRFNSKSSTSGSMKKSESRDESTLSLAGSRQDSRSERSSPISQTASAQVADDTLSISAPPAQIVSVLVSSASPTKTSGVCGDSEDDLNDTESVNLVALDEVTNKHIEEKAAAVRKRNSAGLGEKSCEEGDAPRDKEEWDKSWHNRSQRSGSQLSIGEDSADHQCTIGSGRGKWAKELVDATKKAISSTFKESTIKEEDEPKPGRRSRFPYRFKHHTVNLLSDAASVENRLISTNVLMGHDKDRKRTLGSFQTSAVLSTAVIARSSSAPRLQTYKEEEDLLVTEIKRFWPPLRSLETLHDNLSFDQFDAFLKSMIIKTPIASPSTTPTTLDTQNPATSKHVIEQTIARLRSSGLN